MQADRDAGMTINEICKKYGVSVSTVESNTYSAKEKDEVDPQKASWKEWDQWRILHEKYGSKNPKQPPKFGQWIPFFMNREDSMPKEKGWYLVTVVTGVPATSKPRVMELYWYPGIKQWVDNIRYSENGLKEIEKFCWTDNVTAWMPRPEPYTEGKTWK